MNTECNKISILEISPVDKHVLSNAEGFRANEIDQSVPEYLNAACKQITP